MTGLGAVTPLGADVETTWTRLVAGESGAGPITAFDDGRALRAHRLRGGRVRPLELARQEERPQARPLHAVRRRRRADGRGRLRASTSRASPIRVGASIATAQGGVASLAACCAQADTMRIQPSLVTAFMPNMAAGWVSMELGATGPVTAPCEACAASAMAIGDGYDAIRLGRAEVMLCGGSEAGVTAARDRRLRRDARAVASQRRSGAREPAVRRRAGRIRDGGGRCRARARGARARARAQREGVRGARRLRRQLRRPSHDRARSRSATGRPARSGLALADARLGPEAVDYVNAHASSTPLGDASETAALKLALGEEKARSIPISSLKGATGHCLGAAGAIEMCATVLTVARDVVPPTINYETARPGSAISTTSRTRRARP